MTKDLSAPQQFAVFDIDGTIVRTGLFAQVIHELIAHGHLPGDSKARVAERFEHYRTRSHDDAYREYVDVVLEIFFDNLPTIRVDDYRTAVDRVIRHTRHATYVYTRDLIRDLHEEGYFLIALSGSEMYAVREFCKHLGFDVTIGQTFVEQGGVFTGEMDDIIHSKDRLLQEIITEQGLTLKDSIGVGDTRSDIPMLQLVERPIAFNPERVLFEHAQKMGWEIVVERKNTIVRLKVIGGAYTLV